MNFKTDAMAMRGVHAHVFMYFTFYISYVLSIWSQTNFFMV